MGISKYAGKPAPLELLTNVPRLVSAYYYLNPNLENETNLVSFGTSGHRGSSLKGSYNEDHILAIAQAVCDYRKANKINGPLFLGKDTHALSEPTFMTTMEVFAANEIQVRFQNGFGYTPTPVISHAILNYNKTKKSGFADGVVLTPSHNPPEDGGFKYNPPNGGPANSTITSSIENRANEILKNKLRDVKRISYNASLNKHCTEAIDFIHPYVNDLSNILEMEVIAESGLKIGVDPMGGSGIKYWEPIAEKYKINLEIVNKKLDPTFSFMCVDKDGKIRMDCSSPYAMAGLIKMKDDFDIAFGNDPDYDRHGIVTKSFGLMNPNHYLAVAINYLYNYRKNWDKKIGIGKTLVSSSIIDRVAAKINRRLVEVPVGFKWFVEGLLKSEYGFGGEESAGASFLRKDGTVWTTDKDGIIMDLLAAEITAVTKKDPAQHYSELTKELGEPVYGRIDAPATREQKDILKKLSPENVKASQLADEEIIEKLTKAAGNNAPIGGLKVVTKNGWFAARPSGTEEIYKIYAESFKGKKHLEQIQKEAQNIVSEVFNSIP